MKKINNVKRIYRAYITYTIFDTAYDEERFYVVEYNERLQEAVENIYYELKNDFSKYNHVEFDVEKMVGDATTSQVSHSLILGKCDDQTWEDVMMEFNNLPKRL